MKDIYDLPIESLGISKETATLLKAAGIHKIEDAVELLYGGPPALQAIPGFGEAQITEFIDALRNKGVIQ